MKTVRKNEKGNIKKVKKKKKVKAKESKAVY